jgi:hypothetical protein
MTQNSTTEAMTLETAIALLGRVHIIDLEDDGWAVRMGATPWGWETEHYIQAWETLRNHLLKTRQS